MMRRRVTWPAILCGALVAVTGCGDSDEPSTTDDPASTAVDAATVSTAELLDRVGTDREGDTVIVDALLFGDEAELLICEQLAESFPPQCIGRSVVIRNPDAIDVEFTEDQGIRWTDRTVPLLGWIEDGEFVVT